MWEGWGAARAGDAVRCVWGDGREGKAPAAPTSSLLLPQRGRRHRERRGHGHGSEKHPGIGRVLSPAGKALGHRHLLWHALNDQGEGSWTGHKRGTQRGPPAAERRACSRGAASAGLFSR